MPSKSRAQRNLMRMCSNPKGRAKAQGKCPPQGVAKEYVRADRAKAHKRKGR